MGVQVNVPVGVTPVLPTNIAPLGTPDAVKEVIAVPSGSLAVTLTVKRLPSATLTAGGAITTGGLSALVTVMADVAVFVSLVAVMVADPTATPVTRPFEFTVAAATLLLEKVTILPDNGFPKESLGVALS